MDGLALHLGGGADTFVYPKDDHVPATFTVLNFLVDDIDARRRPPHRGRRRLRAVRGLRSRRTRRASPARREATVPTIAWFKDPAGNILSVLQQ